MPFARASIFFALAILGGLGTAAATSPPIASSPGAHTGALEFPVVNQCPTFSWGSARPATAYEIVVYQALDHDPSSNLPDDSRSPALQLTLDGDIRSWTPSRSHCFDPGGLYVWTLRAFVDQQATPWSEPQVFRVEPMPSKSDVRQALSLLRKFADSPSSNHQASNSPKALTDPTYPQQHTESQDTPGLHQDESLTARSSALSPYRLTTSLTPNAVTAPASPSLTIDGDFSLQGFIFKGTLPFLHDDGLRNTALGINALTSNDNSVGFDNTAVGNHALTNSSLGVGNTALGVEALMSSTSASNNTAVGRRALTSNTDGQRNTAVGDDALADNLSGNNNASLGWSSLDANQSGTRNTAVGASALTLNGTGNDNVAIGAASMLNNQGGTGNTAVGSGSLDSNSGGDGNIALGLGAGQDTTGSNNILIGHGGVEDQSGTIRIGTPDTHANTFVAGISSNAISGTTVVVDSSGQLGIAASSRRFKQNIHTISHESRKLYDLRPVAFTYTEHLLDAQLGTDFGLLAEEVAEILPELVRYDDQSEPLAVRYRALIPLLLNELQYQQQRVHEQHRLIEHLERRLDRFERTFRHFDEEDDLPRD